MPQHKDMSVIEGKYLGFRFNACEEGDAAKEFKYFCVVFQKVTLDFSPVLCDLLHCYSDTLCCGLTSDLCSCAVHLVFVTVTLIERILIFAFTLLVSANWSCSEYIVRAFPSTVSHLRITGV